MAELLLGCGHGRQRLINLNGAEDADFKNLTTVDIDPLCEPDVVHDLNVLPWPFKDEQFKEVHAYEVLEHLGTQGDFRSFFAHFDEIYRILRPGGLLFATVPAWDAEWAWADPGHRRIISKNSLIFLDRDNYEQLGRTAMADYRPYFKCDFRVVGFEAVGMRIGFVLEKK